MNKRMGHCIFAAMAAATMLVGLSPVPARADVTVYFDNNSYKFSGTEPSPDGTWAEATFHYVSSDEVDVTFSIPNHAVSGLFLDQAGFQFNASGITSEVHTGGTSAAITYLASSKNQVAGTGNEEFNTVFSFPNKNSERVKYGQDSVYDITFQGANFKADLSNLFTTPDESGNNYIAAAHLAGYGTSTGLSGHLAAVPEPSTMLIAAVGALGLVGYGMRRRRRG